MNIVEVNELVAKLKNGSISENEEKQLLNWLHHFNMQGNAGFSDGELIEAQQQMWANIKPISQPVKQVKIISIKRWLSVAAAILLVVVTLTLYNKNSSKRFYIANDIAAGTDAATLTLTDGRKINLSASQTGEVAKETGVVIYKNSEGQLVYEIQPSSSNNKQNNNLNTLSTANGQTYMVVLPDGSKVWLNAASSIKYTANFGAQNTREIELQGEAYFEVAQDKIHPFIVKSNGQEVEVLGTHFNVNSYTNETSVKTTLIEGSVKIKSTITGEERYIKPNQQAVLNPNNIQIKTVKTEEIIDWKDGKFIFSNEGIESLMKKIARWYNVEVTYEGDITKERFGGHVSRSQPISTILESLQLTGFVHFKVEGRRVIVLSDK